MSPSIARLHIAVNTAIQVSTRTKWGMRRLVRGALTLLIGVGVQE